MEVYRIEKRPWGLWLSFSGRMTESEVRAWLDESRAVLRDIERPFAVVADMRGLSPLLPEVQLLLVEGQRLYRDHGLDRSAVLFRGPIAIRQFRRIAGKSGIREGERYIDARRPDAEERALAWARDGIEPGDPPGPSWSSPLP